MNKAKQFFQKEYSDHKQKPLLIQLNGKEYVVPLAYLNQTSDEQLAKDNFIDDFFDAQQKDLSLYEKYKIEPKEVEWTDGHTKYTFFVPFALRNKNLSTSEIVSTVFKKAEKKYKKSSRLSFALYQVYPDSQKPVGVSSRDVKSLRKQYDSYLWNKTKNQTKQGALLLANFVKKGIKKAVDNTTALSPQQFKLLAKRYALATLLGVSTYGAYKLSMTELFDASPKQELLSDKDNVSLYNQQVFLNNINEMKAVLCFMENFSPKTFLDGKGVPTIGYGCTYLIDEKGKGDRKIYPITSDMTMTISEANIQKDRYLMFRVLPQIMKDVKVPLSKEEMIASCTFAYVIGPDNFKGSEYLAALNKGIKGAELGRYLLGFAQDQGVVKRNLFANYILTKKLKPIDFLDLRTEGCYTLEMDDCCFMNNGCVQRDENGLGCFKDDRLEEHIQTAKKKRYSKHIGPCKLVHEVLSKEVVDIVKKHAQSKKINFWQLVNNKIKETR